jgi:16S rRNA (cytidine1402-2'-O)-methyltransferase
LRIFEYPHPKRVKTMNASRNLYLIPSTLGDTSAQQVLPAPNFDIIRSLDHFVVEELRTARRFLVRCGYGKPIDTVQFYLLNEHTPEQDVPAFFSTAGYGNMGLISEAGLPAVADPGSVLVREAYKLDYRVIPLVGPSSIMLALMASGLNGQNFAFNGYLPVKNPERATRIRFLEKRSESEMQSQIFIETPYRNHHLIETLLEVCKPTTRLCIAANITLENEWICTKRIQEWKEQPPPDLKKQPAVFILQS